MKMKDLVIVLYNIRSIYNVGSVFRTCDAAGISKIFLVGVTPSPLDRLGNFRKDFAKVALGAEKTVSWEYAKTFGTVYKKLRGEGCEILAVEQDKRSIPYYDYKLKPRRFGRGKNQSYALIFGEETRGLTKSVLDKCDKILEIPMRGATVGQTHHPKNLKRKAFQQARGKESLNVSVSAGIVVYRIFFP